MPDLLCSHTELGSLEDCYLALKPFTRASVH